MFKLIYNKRKKSKLEHRNTICYLTDQKRLKSMTTHYVSKAVLNSLLFFWFYINIHISVFIYALYHIDVHVCICILVYMHVCMHIHIPKCIYKHTYTYTIYTNNIYIYIHTIHKNWFSPLGGKFDNICVLTFKKITLK